MRKTTIAAAMTTFPKVTVLTASVKSASIDCLVLTVETETLQVAFVNGAVYEYEGVPVATFLKVMESDSIGRAYIRLIKNGGFIYNKR